MSYRKISSNVIRSFVFGIEDSLVSTIGLVSGVAVAGLSRTSLIATGIILVFVEAFSMAIGSLLSDNSAKEYTRREAVPMTRSLKVSVVMFLSYLAAGFVVLAPYILLRAPFSFWASIGVSLAALFGLGMYVGYLSGIPAFRRGFIMAFVGGLAIFIGVAVGMVIEANLL